MTEAPADRTYWHVPGARSWHALVDGPYVEGFDYPFICGRSAGGELEMADRVPSDGHLCGSCARVIAARTDIENHSVTATAGIS